MKRPTTPNPPTEWERKARPKSPVTPDSFRGPPRGEGDGHRLQLPPAAQWTPDQVRGDEVDKGTPPNPHPVTPGLTRGPASSRSRLKKRDPGSSAGVTRKRTLHPNPPNKLEREARPKSPVTPDSFRGPLRGEGDGHRLQPPPAARWTRTKSGVTKWMGHPPNPHPVIPGSTRGPASSAVTPKKRPPGSPARVKREKPRHPKSPNE